MAGKKGGNVNIIKVDAGAVAPEALRAIADRLLRATGSNAWEADIVATHLRDANLKGHDSHGIGMMPHYVTNRGVDALVANQVPRRLDGMPGILLFDGLRGYGQVIARLAMEEAIAAAGERGVAAFGIRNSHHMGRIGTYGEQCAAAGLACILFVNVTGHGPLVAPFRGSDARFSTNPICIALPGPEAERPFLLDFATSRVAMGKVRVAREKGETMAAEDLIDHQGRATTDPEVMFQDPMGAIRAFGDHKGYGLALAAELLAGVMSGGGTIQPERPRDHTSIINNLFGLVFDPRAFGDPAGMRQELAAMVGYAQASPPADPQAPVLMPGDPERASAANRGRAGIPMPAGTWAGLLAAADQAGVDRAEMEALRRGA